MVPIKRAGKENCVVGW